MRAWESIRARAADHICCRTVCYSFAWELNEYRENFEVLKCE